MKRGLFLTGLAIFSSVAAAESLNLDTIQVESSTIEDLATDPKIEPSTVNVIDEQQYEIIDPKNSIAALPSSSRQPPIPLFITYFGCSSS